ncbi:MAG: 50S ribosomal protein L11 methyltransferase [Saprospiraceae bacterium]
MIYKSYTIQDTSEILLGLLSIYPFESFEEHDTHMIAYIKEDELDEITTLEIHNTINGLGIDYTIETIEPQNWNALWEASFDPVIIDEFCVIRADFHDTMPNIKHDIIINPKMAFGTGHHETTFMMISAMEKMGLSSKSVFDYGCGTGVLSILASKLGAHPIDAIDIEEESYNNTIENAQTNNVTNINVACSDLESFNVKEYDIILANINRKVLLFSADKLKTILKESGQLLLSGILDQDEKMIIDHYQSAGFTLLDKMEKGYWRCLKFGHN